ncbi:hypothetical protein ACWEQJ_36910 [Streptomyces cyaneofuscatus]
MGSGCRAVGVLAVAYGRTGRWPETVELLEEVLAAEQQNGTDASRAESLHAQLAAARSTTERVDVEVELRDGDGGAGGAALGTDASVRIGLRLRPGPSHPWAGVPPGARPPVDVLVTPLTFADVTPDSAPYEHEEDVEFAVTARRAGPQTVRFTLRHQASGAVLQQVEVDVPVGEASGGEDADHVEDA